VLVPVQSTLDLIRGSPPVDYDRTILSTTHSDDLFTTAVAADD
jgi:hypothetical protein